MAIFRGGMQFREGRPVQISPPPTYSIAEPLRLTCDQQPMVEAGKYIAAGDTICRSPEPATASQLSPIDGLVESVTQWSGPSPTSASVRRDPSGHDRYDVSISPTRERAATSLNIRPPDRAEIEPWCEAVRGSGAWAQPGVGWDLLSQMHAAAQRRPDTLICIGLDEFPPYPDRSSILMSFPDDAALGLHLLGDIVNARRIVMVASQAGRVGARARRACRTFKVRCNAVENIYPGADPTLVVRHHAPGRRTLAHGENPMSCRVMLVTPWTVIRLARWVTMKRLDVVEPMFVAWPRAGAPLTDRWVFIGQPLVTLDPALAGAASVLSGRAVMGNPMTGRAIEAPPTTEDQKQPPFPATPDDERLITVLSPTMPHPQEACIRCGWCADVCPTRLRPIDLVERIDAGRSESVRGELDACIDCGLCSHVCPSSIPLTQSLREARDRPRASA